jgi:general stress protein 26
MVARIATLSCNGRPCVTPLYFVQHNGNIWLGTSDRTLAVRNIRANARVSVLLAVERDTSSPRVLRIKGKARLLTDQQAQRTYRRSVARKYFMTPGGLRNTLAHIRQLQAMRYHIQSTAKGRSCIIEVIPEQAEFISEQ